MIERTHTAARDNGRTNSAPPAPFPGDDRHEPQERTDRTRTDTCRRHHRQSRTATPRRHAESHPPPPPPPGGNLHRHPDRHRLQRRNNRARTWLPGTQERRARHIERPAYLSPPVYSNRPVYQETLPKHRPGRAPNLPIPPTYRRLNQCHLQISSVTVKLTRNLISGSGIQQNPANGEQPQLYICPSRLFPFLILTGNKEGIEGTPVTPGLTSTCRRTLSDSESLNSLHTGRTQPTPDKTRPEPGTTLTVARTRATRFADPFTKESSRCRRKRK